MLAPFKGKGGRLFVVVPARSGIGRLVDIRPIDCIDCEQFGGDRRSNFDIRLQNKKESEVKEIILPGQLIPGRLFEVGSRRSDG
jgi:hypothetical protein